MVQENNHLSEGRIIQIGPGCIDTWKILSRRDMARIRHVPEIGEEYVLEEYVVAPKPIVNRI